MKNKIISLILALTMVCCFIIPVSAGSPTEDADVSKETLETIVTECVDDLYSTLIEQVGNYTEGMVEEMLQNPEVVAAVVKAGVKAYIYSYLYQAGIISDELLLYAGEAVDKAVDMIVTDEIVNELLRYPFVQDVIKTTAKLAVEKLLEKSGITEDRDAFIAQCVEKIMASTTTILYNPIGKYKGSEKITVNPYWDIGGTQVRDVIIYVYTQYTIKGWSQSKIQAYCIVQFAFNVGSDAAKYYNNIKNLSQEELYQIIFDSMGEAAVEEFNNLVAAVIENPAAAFNYYLAEVLSEELGYDVTLDEDDPAGDIINKIIAAVVAAAENGELPTLPGVLGTSANQVLNAALAFVPEN